MLAAALVMGVALAADAFAAALAQGASGRAPIHYNALATGVAFGAAQAIMPLIGWALGEAFGTAFEAIDHWIAFVVLGLLGAKLVKEAFERREGAPVEQAGGWTLLVLALATSIDAAAAGVTFNALNLAPIFTAAVIGAVTAAVCVCGVYAGRAMGDRLGKPAEFAGGAILILLGIKVLWDHGVLAGWFAYTARAWPSV